MKTTPMALSMLYHLLLLSLYVHIFLDYIHNVQLNVYLCVCVAGRWYSVVSAHCISHIVCLHIITNYRGTEHIGHYTTSSFLWPVIIMWIDISLFISLQVYLHSIFPTKVCCLLLLSICTSNFVSDTCVLLLTFKAFASGVHYLCHQLSFVYLCRFTGQVPLLSICCILDFHSVQFHWFHTVV